MPPFIASIICGIGIAGLFYLDRGEKPRVSRALIIPAVWMLLNTTHPLSFWLGMSNQGSYTTEAYVEGNPFDRNVALVLQLAALIVLCRKSAKVGAILRQNPLLLAYFSFCLVSVLWSDFPFVTFKRWIKALGDVQMVLVILVELDPFAALTRILTRMGFFLFPLSILFIRFYPDIGRRPTNSWTQEPVGVTQQKNELGIMCMVYGIFFLWMLLSAYREGKRSGKWRRMLAYGTIIAMSVYLLNLCNSTTSIVGFASSAGVLWLASRRPARPALVHSAVLTVLGLAVTALFFNPGGGLVQSLGKDPTLTGRRDIWALVLGLHTNPLIGTGFETFWLGSRLKFMLNALVNLPINEAHNGWIEVYLNLGWVGLFFITLLIMTGYKRIISHIRQDPEKGCLFLGFLLCALFYCFSEAGFRFGTMSWFFLLLIIISPPQGVSLANNSRPDPLRPTNIASDEKPAHATQDLSLISRTVRGIDQTC
jgi:exopolysaccharide production protein ExoQ